LTDGGTPQHRGGDAMTALSLRLRRRRRSTAASDAMAEPQVPAQVTRTPAVDIADDDPLLAYMAQAGGAVELGTVTITSPAVEALREAGVVLVVPLITQGELLGLLTLGPRLSEQVYSAEDRKLLEDLAGYAAPAVRIAQLVREHEAEVRERSRIEQELRVATLIQQQFLPRELPRLDGWRLEAFYRPAREVGGDFYDFIELPEGRLGIVVGDVTDKGVPAALIMAKTHSLLRGDAPRLVAPGAVLARTNELLVAEMPANMFVTCLFAVLDPESGVLRFANAGHPVPYVRGTDGQVRELRARGMPLGLLSGMEYEEIETVLRPGERVLLHSDGIAEAHDEKRDMFGFPRLEQLVGADCDPRELIDAVLSSLEAFTESGSEQEDDITLVALARAENIHAAADPARDAHKVLDFELQSVSGNERIAMDRVREALAPRDLPTSTLERISTAVGEATMNAIEHGNHNDPELTVRIELHVDADTVVIRVTDRGGGPEHEPEEPDIDAKLQGLQSPRGWGLFLIREMVDDLRVTTATGSHTLELIVATSKGDGDAQDR
jgi:serine phosphatase RsbU (regulator of sigma subunit)/anti-sigma regulatory factor (Ser/Thr protein kinase)